MRQLVERRSGEQNLISIFNVFSESEGSRIHSEPECKEKSTLADSGEWACEAALQAWETFECFLDYYYIMSADRNRLLHT